LATVDTKLTIIGCGDASLIADYAARTECPYPIYCDPTRATYEKLGMVCSLNQKSKPDYLSKSQLSLIKSSLFTALGMGVGKAWKAGKISRKYLTPSRPDLQPGLHFLDTVYLLTSYSITQRTVANGSSRTARSSGADACSTPPTTPRSVSSRPCSVCK
jgi:hypothetical protein